MLGSGTCTARARPASCPRCASSPSATSTSRRSTATSNRRLLGASGEEAVAAWYRAQGYEIVARNWRCREGELDVIATRGSVLVFCEVKTRSSTAFGVPAEAVTLTKQRRLRRLAVLWLAAQEGARPHAELRFDVASVLAGSVEVLEGAF